MNQPNVVIITNVLLTTINRNNAEFFIYDAFRDKRFNWVVNTEILAEYEEMLTDFYSTLTANLVLKIPCTATNVIFAEPYFRWPILTDPDDTEFSDLALTANALCLVIYDKRFDAFKTLSFPTLTIVSPAQFKALLPA
jgi:uncharacterized protein